MLLPKKVAHRKVRIGKNRGNATRGNYVAFGDYGLQSLDNERITSRQNLDSYFPAYASHQKSSRAKDGWRQRQSGILRCQGKNRHSYV